MKRITIVIIILFFSFVNVFSQQKGKAKVAVIQADATSIQDLFVDEFDFEMITLQMNLHLEKLLKLFKEAGKSGADIVCGPEDMQHIGPYGLHIDIKHPKTGEILFNSLALEVPGKLTDEISEIAKQYDMYIIAPLYEKVGDEVFNTSVVFDRQGKIMGKHRKTLLPVLETWLVSRGNEFNVYETDFGNFAIATCWEIFYPEIASIYALKGADIIFNPTMANDNKPGESLSTAHMFITRAKDNSVYIAPSVLGKDGNGIIDFNGDVIAEELGRPNVVVMTEIDFSIERTTDSKWWETIDGTNNIRALHLKSRRPELYNILIDINPPLMERYYEINLTTGDRKRQFDAVRKVDYGKRE